MLGGPGILGLGKVCLRLLDKFASPRADSGNRVITQFSQMFDGKHIEIVEHPDLRRPHVGPFLERRSAHGVLIPLLESGVFFWESRTVIICRLPHNLGFVIPDRNYRNEFTILENRTPLFFRLVFHMHCFKIKTNDKASGHVIAPFDGCCWVGGWRHSGQYEAATRRHKRELHYRDQLKHAPIRENRSLVEPSNQR